MDEDRCKEVHEVYDKLVHMHREPWTHRGTSTADPLPLSTWSEFRDKRYDFITEGIVFGLDVPGTMHELIQYTRGELRGAALDQQRVVIPQLVFVKHLLDALGERSQRDVSAHKVVAYASDSGFCPENIEMLKYFGINAVPAVRLPNSAYSLVVDLRTKHWKFFDEKDLGSLFNSQWHLPPSSSWVIPPGAILKRFSTLQLPFPGLVPCVICFLNLTSAVAILGRLFSKSTGPMRFPVLINIVVLRLMFSSHTSSCRLM